jgi:hypothetical protein
MRPRALFTAACTTALAAILVISLAGCGGTKLLR